MTDAPSGAPGPDAASGGGSGFTPEQVQMMDGWLRDAGTHPDQLAQQKQTPAAPPGFAEPDPAKSAEAMSVEAAEVDKFFPIAQAAEFETPNFSSIASSLGETLTNEQLMQVDTTVRSWLATAELPKAIGNHIASEAAKVDDLWQTMNEPTRKIWAQKQNVLLEKMYGAKLNEKLDLARDFVRQVGKKHPEFIDYLEDSGAGNAASVVAQIINHAERQATRYAGRK
ncbi:hypothetical protein [Rhodospirillaceae bacterium SYSU D60014]|uniref:hypothetical protein n=1 Tax=Virgifigura deserti TaxID=2268457 RepID=UPI000E67352D